MKKLNSNKLIKCARTCASFEELAEAMKWKKVDDHGMEEFVIEVARICPGVETLIEVYEAEQDLKDAILSGNEGARKEARETLIGKIVRAQEAGYRCKTKADVPAQKIEVKEVTLLNVEWFKGRKRAGLTAELEAQLGDFRKTLSAVTECVACDALKGDVLGYVPKELGESYYGRKKVLLVLRPGVFGQDVVSNTTIQQVTLHNGILNQTSLEEYPSILWMVLDVMSDLGKFTREKVLKKAEEMYGEQRDKKHLGSIKKFRFYLLKAYYVIKSHHVHGAKCFTGMSHMVVDLPSLNEEDKGKMEIRGRLAHETYEYFQEHQKKLEASKAGAVPMASLD